MGPKPSAPEPQCARPSAPETQCAGPVCVTISPMRRMPALPRGLAGLLPTLVAAPVLMACSPSPVDLASEVARAPGVIEVDAHDSNDGDNDIPARPLETTCRA